MVDYFGSEITLLRLLFRNEDEIVGLHRWSSTIISGHPQNVRDEPVEHKEDVARGSADLVQRRVVQWISPSRTARLSGRTDAKAQRQGFTAAPDLRTPRAKAV
jgi:hypothetical protein